MSRGKLGDLGIDERIVLKVNLKTACDVVDCYLVQDRAQR